MFRIGSAASYAALVAAWLIVAVRTAHGSARGALFLPPATMRSFPDP